MNRTAVVVIGGLALCASGVMADQVIEQVPDTLPGKAFGGLSGFMAGSVIGGPAGAIVGALAGAWTVGALQNGTAAHDYAYRVEKADGQKVVVRSPGQAWSNGDQVSIVGNRLQAAE